MSQHPVYRRGDAVEVFYRMGYDEGGHYFPVATPAAGLLRPRFGRSDGWMSARIDDDWPPAHHPKGNNGQHQMPPPRVRVRHTHQHWGNRRGERLDPLDDRDMVVFVPPADVRRPAGNSYRPAVSLFIVRWGGEPTLFNVEQWGAASSSVSDSYIDFVVERTLYQRLGPDYEVYTAYVESGEDMRKLMPSVIAPMLTGRHVAGLYFLWPIMAQDGGDIDQSGMVNQADYFGCVHGFEAAGVPTRFPHASQLYHTLLSKDWQPLLCLNSKLRVPCATVINRAAVVRSPRRAAAAVLDALEQVRALRYAESSEPDCLRPMEGEARRGVVKLGFAWEASYVRVFRGEVQLAEALEGLISTPGVQAPSLIVQDFVKNHLEIRCFIVDGRIATILYTSFERVDVDGYPRDFVKKERGAAVAHWLEGDMAAMEDAERKASRLVSQWLVWLRCQSSEPTPCIRMDLLVSRAGPGRSEVHTLELTEMGFSMLAWPDGPRVVFNALVESFFNDVEHTAADESLLAAARPPPLSGPRGGPELPRARPFTNDAQRSERPSRKERKKQKRRDSRGWENGSRGPGSGRSDASSGGGERDGGASGRDGGPSGGGGGGGGGSAPASERAGAVSHA